MNLIMQHWNGDLPRWAQLAERTVRDYADDIGVEYELVRGHPLGEAMGPNPQKVCYLLEKYDEYEYTVMIDMDMIATKQRYNVFDIPQIGVLHDRAMKDDGSSLTPTAAPELYKKGEYIFFGNFIKLHRDQRIALREYLDVDYIAPRTQNKYAGDETVLHYLIHKSGILKDKTIEEVCMRCSGTSYKDIHYRKHDRFDRKFANDPVAPNAFVDRSDKDAVFLHFGQAKKNNIENVVKDMYGEIYASI